MKKTTGSNRRKKNGRKREKKNFGRGAWKKGLELENEAVENRKCSA